MSFNLLLNRCNLTCQHATLCKWFVIWIGSKHGRIKNSKYFISPKNTHDLVGRRKEELCCSWISLSSRTSTELVVDTSGFVFFCSKNRQSSDFYDSLTEFDIRSTSCHIGGNSDSTKFSGFGNYFCFFLVMLGIENSMGDIFFFEQTREVF